MHFWKTIHRNVKATPKNCCEKVSHEMVKGLHKKQQNIEYKITSYHDTNCPFIMKNFPQSPSKIYVLIFSILN